MLPFGSRQEASAFNQPLSFGTSSVTTMIQMFGRASAFNQPLSLDTSSVTTMEGMLYNTAAFNKPLSFDTSSVTTMVDMFGWATAFNQPLSFDTSSVIAMQYMFDNNPLFSDANKLLIRCAWAGNTEFVTRYGSAWSGLGACSPAPPPPPPSPPYPPGAAPQPPPSSPPAYAFTDKASLLTAAQEYNADAASATATYGPISSWGVSAVTDMNQLFQLLGQFNADISSWDTSSVTTMTGMFNRANAFNQPLSFDTSSVTNMYYMFGNTPLLSDANKLLIRCAWAGNTEFISQYGSAWPTGAC